MFTTKKKKIFVLLGHPYDKSLCSALSDAYVEEAQKSGHEVRYTKLGSLTFDPILHKGYVERQELEPDLVTFQQNVCWAEHVVFVFPTWWGTMPALLKGLFDRAWLPGFAFNFKKNGFGWKKHLKGRTAHIITTSNSPAFILNWIFGARLSELRLLTLWFAGFAYPRMTRFSGMAKPREGCVPCVLKKVRKLGKKGL